MIVLVYHGDELPLTFGNIFRIVRLLINDYTNFQKK